MKGTILGNNIPLGKRKNNMSGLLLILPVLILFYFTVWRPIGIAAHHSLFRMEGYNPQEFVGLDTYKEVISDPSFIKALKNTFIYIFWSVLIGVPIPLFTAVLLNEVIVLKGYFKFSFYLPAMLPVMAVSLLWLFIYSPGSGGLLNYLVTLFGGEPLEWLQNRDWTIPLIVISVTWSSFGSMTIIYFAAIQGVDVELYEAARLDGAGAFARLRYILIPRIGGVIALLTLKQVINIFQLVEQPLAMTGGGPDSASLSLALQNYFYAFVYFKTDKSLALSVIMFVLLAVFACIFMAISKKSKYSEGET